VKRHREAASSAAFDDFIIADRTAGLDDGGRTGFGRREQSVGEGKICVRRRS